MDRFNTKEKPVIVYGVGFYDSIEGKEVTHNITNIFVDSFAGLATFVIERGLKVTAINMSMEEAQSIGFINVKALNNFCK